ncbi:hypothetical protein ACIQUM_07750 [Amycolatopsis azurea]|uniref:hypothetical protein n=1 Tax=Amycolatopsis azurea TaxID=36819 RepID=UPI0038204BE3
MGILNTDAATHRKTRKKRPDDLLSSVVRETAVQAAIDLLRRNTPFGLPSGTAWVMLVLAAADIGGLSKRHGRDEAKGSIIELIGSDQIKTVATAAMLEDEIFGIIPSEDTLARMDEYTLLAKAPYTWAVVWQDSGDGLLIDLADAATFTQARDVCAGSISLAEAIGARAWSKHSGVAEDEPTVSAADGGGAPSDGDPAGDPDDPPVFAEPFAADGAENPVGTVEVEPDEPTFGDTAGFAEFDDQDDPPESHASATAHDDTAASLSDQDEVREAIARRFLSEDLDLAIGLDEFTATFAIGAPAVQIEMPHNASEWLGDQVGHLNRQANADLAQLRAAHEDALRLLFVSLTSAHVEQVIRDVATDRDGSRYQALKNSIEQAHRERLAEKGQRIEELSARIEDDYQQQATALGRQAASEAETQFKQRNRSRMKREQLDAISVLDRELDDAYTRDLQELLRVRRSDAALKMQIGTTRIFDALAERQADHRAAEEQRLDRWRTDIGQVVDDNRKADVARIEAMAEHQRTVDEVAALRREQDALLQSQRAAHTERIRTLEEQLERDRREAVASMHIRDAEWRHTVGVEQERTKAQIARVAELLQQISTAESSENRRWNERIVQLKDDHAAQVQRLTQAAAIQARTSRVLVVVMVAISVLVAVAGFIAGAVLGG